MTEYIDPHQGITVRIPNDATIHDFVSAIKLLCTKLDEKLGFYEYDVSDELKTE